jgi:MFS family permease
MVTPTSDRPGRFPALRSRDFRLLWMGQMVSMAGSQMQQWTLNWQLYDLTGSAMALGTLGLVRIVPMALFALAGGTVADAVDRRRMMLMTQGLLMLIAALLGWLTWSGTLTALAIYTLAAVSAAAVAFDGPARQSLLPNLVPREHFINATSLMEIVRQVAQIAGPSLAGLLIAAGGTHYVYWINALSFLAVLGALAVIRVGPAQGPRPRMHFAALKEGLGFLKGQPLLYATMLLDFLATLFASANTLLPIFARDVLHVGARGYGILAAAPAVGSLLAGGVLISLAQIHRQGVVMLAAVAAYGVATLLFGLSHWYLLSLAAFAATGAADTVSSVIRRTLRQLLTPDHLRGRVTAISMLFFMGGPQLGEFEAGLVAAWFGAPLSVVIGGLGCLATVALVAWRSPRLRTYTGEGP